MKGWASVTVGKKAQLPPWALSTVSNAPPAFYPGTGDYWVLGTTVYWVLLGNNGYWVLLGTGYYWVLGTTGYWVLLILVLGPLHSV